MRRLGTLLAACLLAALATPAGGAPAGAITETRSAGAVRAVITFDKDRRHPFDSRVVWRVFRQQPDRSWTLLERRAWRAGSGFGGPNTTHECVRNRGWLPNGRYSFVQYNDYRGSLIKGRVFFLGSHRCRNGTMRHELFIHTETGAGNRQCADGPGDQICRWEWPKINDYRSSGCIKMSPPDLLALTRQYHRWFHAGVRYPMQRVQVRVVP